MTSHRSCPHSFTLVELLVVIAVLGLVAALAVPAIGKARESANRGGCALNLKALAAGVLTYSTENNGRLPTIYQNPLGGTNVTWWQAALQTTNNYSLKVPGTGPKCMYCPSQKIPVKYKSSGAVATPSQDWGYGINGLLVGSGNQANPPPPVPLARITNPSRIILLGDGAAGDEDDGNSWSISYLNPAQAMSARHGSNVTVAWCDGHVSFTNRDSLTNTTAYPQCTNFWGRGYAN